MADVRVFGMGRNNRQRRAAKQKARARRGPTPPHQNRSESELLDDLLRRFGDAFDEEDEFEDDSFHDRNSAWPATHARQHQQIPPSPPTTCQQARALLDRLLSWANMDLSADGLTSAMTRELRGQPSEVLLRLDELASGALLQAAGPLWERGWQPRDLIHVAARLDKWAGALAADLSVVHLHRSGRLELAPSSWHEQLGAARDRARAAGIINWSTNAEPAQSEPAQSEPALWESTPWESTPWESTQWESTGSKSAESESTGSEWVAVDQLLVAGASALVAWTTVIRLLARIQSLPPLARTLPPPSAWGQSAEPPPRTTRSTRPNPPNRSTAQGAPGANRDKVLTTIRALLAKAESTQFAAEAEALTAKAQSMMTRHAIDEALLHAGAEESVEVISRRILIDNPYLVEKVHLLSEVGHANRSKVVWMGDDYAMATVVGTPVDVDQVELLFVSLLIQATRAMAEAGANRTGSFDRSPRFRRSFLTAYAVRIGERLTEADAEATASYGSELVPVLRRQEEAVDARYEELFPHTTQLNSRKTYDRRGWDAGREAADRARFVQGRIAG
ncbi:hypothetical protein MLP_25260 [Microlunatus phosphovorus NM-1]|uniref:DUF2786 domain-containing protein n=1 Tax=Microlunatus phosphovorus (strain ATCC 700054 / DSM 10555 / JCM 9379 / NBRC 101784 / NCIMB 13414 / VKM Ac-1990 / NM-1) TaxID=1032480 RepID=F5XGQ8_MICPN|nr:DUF2786 domain-containing protein [Microlunatus phosphovorus]BAK35540.1 hypothetical protein MLP_25260 [Microlunatus phosphovorus NM-1]